MTRLAALPADAAPELTELQVRILADLDELRAAVLEHPDAACFSASLIYPSNDGTGSHTTHGTWQRAEHIPMQTHIGALQYMIARMCAG